MSDVLRTPEERFQNLPDFPYAPTYRDDLTGFERLRMHYVDAGPPDAGHFVQEWGEEIARRALSFFGA